MNENIKPNLVAKKCDLAGARKLMDDRGHARVTSEERRTMEGERCGTMQRLNNFVPLRIYDPWDPIVPVEAEVEDSCMSLYDNGPGSRGPMGVRGLRRPLPSRYLHIHGTRYCTL